MARVVHRVGSLEDLRRLVREEVGAHHDVVVSSVTRLRDAPAVFDILNDVSVDFGWVASNIQRVGDLADLVLKVDIPQMRLHMMNLDYRRDILHMLVPYGYQAAWGPVTQDQAEFLMSKLEDTIDRVVRTLLYNSGRAVAFSRGGDLALRTRVGDLHDLLSGVGDDVVNVDARVPDTAGTDLDQAHQLILDILHLQVRLPDA